MSHFDNKGRPELNSKRAARHRTGASRCRRLGLAAALVCAMATPASSTPASPGDSVARRSAAVAQAVIGILGYARWPEGTANPVRLCVFGPTQYTDVLLNGEVLYSAGRPVLPRRMHLDDPQAPASCDAVYTGSMSPLEQQVFYGRLTGRPILSLTEAGGPCTVGPMFCLHVSDEAVSFLVNLDSVARSGVRVHPSVLKLGTGRGGRP